MTVRTDREGARTAPPEDGLRTAEGRSTSEIHRGRDSQNSVRTDWVRIHFPRELESGKFPFVSTETALRADTSTSRKLTAYLERVSGETFRTEAYRVSVIDFAESVRAARVGIARVRRRLASRDRIASVSRQAFAYRFVVEDFADGVRAAPAGVAAFPVDACLVTGAFVVALASEY